MEVVLKQHELKLKHRFTISRDSYDSQLTLIVILKEDNFHGLGEAPSKAYYGITIEKMIDDIESVEPILKNINGVSQQDFWNKLHPYFKDNMFALCALDMAYNDLYAKKKRKKLYNYWGLSIENNPKTNYTIGIDSIDEMITKVNEMPWPIYKIKLGTKDDISIIKALRKHTNAIFRVDANCAWTVDETIENSIELQKLGVEFIEQPLKADNWKGHREVYLNSKLPIIADESCLVENDVTKCHDHFHGINVKLVKCGGLTPAKRMLLEAKELNMKTMVGCMTESSVGISAIAHLLPLLDYVDMDGAILLTNDIAHGITINDGVIVYSKSNGIGATLIE